MTTDIRQHVDDIGRVIRELGELVDAKIATGEPASPGELQAFDKIKAAIPELRRHLAKLNEEWKRSNEQE